MQGLKIFAGTNVGLRDNNEDNFTVCPDLRSGGWTIPADHQQVLPLGDRGSLLLVADGMGGQNAGEVASAIAVQTVEALFSPEALSAASLDNDNEVRHYLLKAIEKADACIKAHAHDHTETSGMGSTLVMAWILNGVAHVAWIGDSRAYAVMPSKGIARLIKDHSFVQGLVDKGQITEEEAMTHPNSNIITRSLGDMTQRARGDAVSYPLHNGEVVLLCSDGLCGVCSDAVIGGIVEDYVADLQQCKEQLTNAALRAGGSDNITIALAQYFDDRQAPSDVQRDVEYKPMKSSEASKSADTHRHVSIINVLFCVFAFLILSALGYAGWHLFGSKEEEKVKTQIHAERPRNKTQKTDSSKNVKEPDTIHANKLKVNADEVNSLKRVKKIIQNKESIQPPKGAITGASTETGGGQVNNTEPTPATEVSKGKARQINKRKDTPTK